MNTKATIREHPSQLSARQIAALISLLSDDDTAIYLHIRDTLLSYGSEAVPWLRPYLLHEDPVLRRRAQEIVNYQLRQEADNRFLAFCLNQPEDLDMEQGAFLLAQTQYADVNIAAYQALLDEFAAELRDQLADKIGPEKILATLNHYLFKQLEFKGNEQNYYDPDNSYFNRVIDRRMGNPISLCLLFLVIGRRLRLPVVGIGMPGHFLCRYQTSIMETFIDVFNAGRLLSKADCIKYLLQAGHGYLESYLSPVSPRRMLLRMCANLHQIYIDLERHQEGSRLQRYIVALSK